MVRFRARPEFRIARQTPRFIDTGRIAADNAVVLGAEAALISGPLSLQAEYTASGIMGREPGTPGGNSTNQTNNPTPTLNGSDCDNNPATNQAGSTSSP